MGELFGRLSGDMMLLVRQELELFRVEMTEKMRETGTRVAGGAVVLSVAAICGLFALAAVTTTVILLFAIVLPAWVGALIVACLYGIAGALLAVRGKHQLEDVTPPVPEQTIATVKEDIAWAKTRTTSARR